MLGKDFYSNWAIYNVTAYGQGKTFMECEDLIRNNLKLVGFDEGLLMESKNWTGGK